MVNKRTSHLCIAHWHRPSSPQQLHEVTNAHRPTCLPFETMQNGDSYRKDGLLKGREQTAARRPPVAHSLSVTGDHRAVQHMQLTLTHELQFCVDHNGHIRCHSSCLICTLPTADYDVGGRRLVIVGYGWSGHASVDRHLDSPHIAASRVYSLAFYCHPGMKEI